MKTHLASTIIFAWLFSLSLFESVAQSDREPPPFQADSETYEVEAIGASARAIYIIRALPAADDHDAIADLQVVRHRDAALGLFTPLQPWVQSAFDFAIEPSETASYPTIMSPSHHPSTSDTAERLDLEWTRSIVSPQ